MIRIALCDDDPNYIHELHQKIVAWYGTHEQNETVSVTEFSDSEYLASSIGESAFDLLFLDVQMPKIDGLKLAETIRAYLPSAIIIFLTSYSEYAQEGYKVRAFRYLSKLALDTQLPEALRSAMKEFHQMERGILTVSYYGDIFRIPYQDIVYVRHVLRHSQIATARQGTIKDSRGIKALHAQLADERFIFVDRSTFVNLDFIRQMRGCEIMLRNGESVYASRPMLPKVKETINRLWGG